jgi:uncharacterized membrane protein
MKFLPLAILLSSVAACSGTNSKFESATCPPNTTLNYVDFGKPLIDKSCSGSDCHTMGGSKGGISLDGIGNVQKYKAEVYNAAAADNTKMPQGRSMSSDERKKLGDWLACGAK